MANESRSARFTIVLLTVVTGVALLAAGLRATAQETPSPAAQVDAIFADYDNTRSPGCALGVIRDGEMILARGYGMADLVHGVPQLAVAANGLHRQ